MSLCPSCFPRDHTAICSHENLVQLVLLAFLSQLDDLDVAPRHSQGRTVRAQHSSARVAVTDLIARFEQCDESGMLVSTTGATVHSLGMHQAPGLRP